MTERIFNFSAGPAVLPEPVLQQAQRDLFALPGVGMSVLEISHRSAAFEQIIAEAEADLRQLLGIPANYKVLFLQGGASLQFTMIPMNLLPKGASADYILTGSWGQGAIKEAKKLGAVREAATTADTNFNRLPARLDLDANAAYVHFTSNETIFGVEFQTEPQGVDAPLVCDMSSNFISRPVDVAKYGLIYAGAQKNAGPAGATIVIIREDLLERVPANAESLPAMLDYKNLAKNGSMYNTPPCFAIYICGLVFKWALAAGGLQQIHARNAEKAKVLYDAIDGSDDYYRGHAEKDCRSLMNVTFRLPNEDAEKKFIKEATAAGLDGLKGHRSVGGLRASIYNAFPKAGVEKLVEFMSEFQKSN
jgi:phosphoserine aminotransferase